jgi:hypothetical protein
MDTFNKRLKRIHLGDLKTLLEIYWENKPIFKSGFFWSSMILAIVTIFLPSFVLISKIEIIRFISDNAITIFPNILGFNLGGYILLISLNTSNILDELTEPEEGKDFSFYQKMSSVFAFSILIQVSILIFSLISLFVMHIGEGVYVNYWLAEILNYLSLFISSFLLAYSTLLIFQIVLNIFNFGQVIHFLIRMDNIDKTINLNPKNQNRKKRS